MRSNPDQLGIVIRQTRLPAYAEAPVERWDRTYLTSPLGESNNTRDKKKMFKLTKSTTEAGQDVEKQAGFDKELAV